MPHSHDHRRPAGGHRHRRHGPRLAGEHHGQERKSGGSGGRRRHAALGQDGNDHHRQPPGDAVRALRRLHGGGSRTPGGPGLCRRPNARGQEHRGTVPSAWRPNRRRRRTERAENQWRCPGSGRIAVRAFHGPNADERRRLAGRPADSQRSARRNPPPYQAAEGNRAGLRRERRRASGVERGHAAAGQRGQPDRRDGGPGRHPQARHRRALRATAADGPADRDGYGRQPLDGRGHRRAGGRGRLHRRSDARSQAGLHPQGAGRAASWWP